MRQHYSDDRAVASRKSPEQKNMTPIVLPDIPLEGGKVNELRSVGTASEIRYYHSVLDDNGDYVRDNMGNAVIGKRIRRRVN